MPKTLAKNRVRQARGRSPIPTRSRKVNIVHGGKSRLLLTAPLDRRTVFGRAYAQQLRALELHLGDDLTPPQARLVDQAARLALLGAVAWNELAKEPFDSDGAAAPSFDVYLRTTQQEREVLRVLGLERRLKDVPDLRAYLAAQDEEQKVPDG